MRRTRTMAAVLCFTAFTTAGARADADDWRTPSPALMQKADWDVHEGLRLMAQQKWLEAAERFGEAWLINRTYDVAANLGYTEYRLGEYADAAEHLAFALRHWPFVGDKEPRELAQKRMEELRKLVASVTIDVSVPRALVSVDGRPRGISPIDHEVFVEAGTRTIEVERPGYADAKQVIEAPKGSAQTMTLTLVANAPAASTAAKTCASAVAAASSVRSAPPIKAEPRGGPNKAIVIAGGATAGAALIAGVVFTVLANGKARDADRSLEQLRLQHVQCTNPPAAGPCKDLLSLRQDQGTFRDAGAHLLVGGVVVAAATVAYALWPRRKIERSTQMRALPVLAPTGAGVWLTGAF